MNTAEKYIMKLKYITFGKKEKSYFILSVHEKLPSKAPNKNYKQQIKIPREGSIFYKARGGFRNVSDIVFPFVVNKKFKANYAVLSLKKSILFESKLKPTILEKGMRVVFKKKRLFLKY